MINVNGHKLNLITDENKVIIYDLDNILTKQESLGIMLYLEEEGFQHLILMGLQMLQENQSLLGKLDLFYILEIF